nr:MAG TPA: hypothetical protein [Caudoviricetes sp.]
MKKRRTEHLTGVHMNSYIVSLLDENKRCPWLVLSYYYQTKL